MSIKSDFERAKTAEWIVLEPDTIDVPGWEPHDPSETKSIVATSSFTDEAELKAYLTNLTLKGKPFVVTKRLEVTTSVEVAVKL